MTATFPTSPAQLEDTWLTTVLRDHGLGGGRVTGHTARPVGEPGQTGELVLIDLEYDDPGDAPSSLAAKFAAPYPDARAFMHALGFYAREINFYKEFGGDPGLPVPTCYFAEIEPQTGVFLLLLEDLRHARNGDFWTGSLADVELAVEHLAPFHARWWNHDRVLNSSWMVKPDDRAYYGALREYLAGVIPTMIERHGAAFSRTFEEPCRRLYENWDALMQWDRPGPFTLTHNDFHPKQIFFPGDEGGRFAVFDWQGAAVGLGAADLARIIAMGLVPAQAKEHGRRLAERYHELLCSHGVHDYDLETLYADFRLSLLWSLWIMTVAVAQTDTAILEAQASERGVDWQLRTFDDLAEVLGHFSSVAMLG